ncbi:MAG: hypothetical protein BWX88_03603 [Planctomycetes bacterium ADurb.Bin126]|nr:MAG: hypothetical protein BWX88_03603 [Planctomycetes bacterium ADurb.Bin126]HOD84040.1 GH116 family glycosyl hydrolase [Phycisphaerae bacterium]HQL73866.1 GH116 family glycosyl hydrolase [Phycisphaerae bacterium]
MSDSTERGCSDTGSCGCSPASRREFLKLAFSAAAAGTAGHAWPAFAGPFEPADTADHYVPADKKLKDVWVRALFERGRRQVYAGEDLRMIGMPVGGITTGQVYLSGDGRLLHWDIFNQTPFSGYGAKNYFADPPGSPLEQAFTLSTTDDQGRQASRTLDVKGFPAVAFCGEYPMAWVDFEDKTFGVSARLEAFSPFCPLKEEDSALPVVVMRYTLTNRTDKPLRATVLGVLENAVGCLDRDVHEGFRGNAVVRDAGWVMVQGAARQGPSRGSNRPPVVIEDFEGKDYGKWTVEGEAFGKAPAKGTIKQQQKVSGFGGRGLVNTYFNGSDQTQGKLTSPPFTVQRDFICFLIGGGHFAGKTCINLLVDGKAVRTMAGQDNEKLEWRHWDVKEFRDKEARIEIVDAESGPWGHINIDQIEQRDLPPSKMNMPFDQRPDVGTMGIALLDAPAALAHPAWPPVGTSTEPPGSSEVPLKAKLTGALAGTVELKAGESKPLTFAIVWHFPNRPKNGNRYTAPFKNAADVVRHLAANFERLCGQTRLWHRTWYEDSTLPRWLLDRLFSTVSTLATGTCQWWANGRFWAWEGVGCCHGTCAHVWNYEHAMARLFPALERSCRTMQDLEPTAGFIEKTGEVRFRGEGWGQWAGDSQGGTALKCLREHQTSADGEFLKQYWPRIKKTIQFLIDQDADGDGLIEGRQHNTYDIDFYGPNTMVGSLYLGALRAGEEMAREMGDNDFAATCRRIFEAGVKSTDRRLWNGEYFIQEVDLTKHPKHQYGDGCLSDQLFGEGWARQVGLGRLYPSDKTRSALKAIWAYNWAPDVGPQNEKHPPQRWFARPGEAGLFTCTWPKGKHLGKDSVLYRDEIWTGIEYQVAGNMVWEDMTTEALAICRGVHDRYHPARHNPWNEIECGDHYARGMASYGVFLALCGFELHGPKRHIGFAPRLTPQNFKAAFTGPAGWGTFSQTIEGGKQSACIAVRWGNLALKTIALGLPPAKDGAAPAQPTKLAVSLGDKDIPAELKIADGQAAITLAQETTIPAGQELKIVLA